MTKHYDIAKSFRTLQNTEQELNAMITHWSEHRATVVKAKNLAHDILTGYKPAGMSASESRTMLIHYYALEGPTPAIRCLAVPNLYAPRKWHLPIPGNKPGVQTMTPTEVNGTVVTNRLIDLYAEGIVTIAEQKAAMVKSCEKCHRPAPFVCQHLFDYDSDFQSITIHWLCLSCPSVETIYRANLKVDEASSLLPPRKPPTPRRQW